VAKEVPETVNTLPEMGVHIPAETVFLAVTEASQVIVPDASVLLEG